MLFVGIALLIAVGLAMLVSLDVGSLVGIQQDQLGQALPLVIILVVIASSVFARRMPLRDMLGGILSWVVIFAVVIGAYSYRTELSGFANRFLGELVPDQGVTSENGQVVTFQRGVGRSFYLTTDVNGTSVRMIFDTGASAVVLTYRDAQRIGINVDNLRFSIPVQTANGTGRAARISLDQISIGGINRGNISAFVAEPDALETSLLGMTFLETLESYTVASDSLELRG